MTKLMLEWQEIAANTWRKQNPRYRLAWMDAAGFKLNVDLLAEQLWENLPETYQEGLANEMADYMNSKRQEGFFDAEEE